MTITLYELAAADPNIRFSPHCWKSRLSLVHKQLPHHTIPIGFTEKDKIAFSKQALVPVMVDDDNVLSDSWKIALYLEEHYPERPSLFVGKEGKALADSINQWCDSVLSTHIRPLVIMAIFNRISEADKAYFREDREQKFGMTLEQFDQGAQQSLVELREAFESIREQLKDRDYLGGAVPSYADICVLSMLLWIVCVRDIELFDDSDIVSQWYQRMLVQYREVLPDRIY